MMNETKSATNQHDCKRTRTVSVHSTITNHKDDKTEPSKKRKRASSSPTSHTVQNLPWYIPDQNKNTDLHTELSLLPILIRRKNEHGMLNTKSSSRIKKTIAHCESLSMPIMQALSLRRHHIIRLAVINGRNRNMEALGLGSHQNIKTAADLFEDAIQTYLQTFHISFLTENDQRNIHYKAKKQAKNNNKHVNGWKTPPTPDFLFDKPVHVSKMSTSDESHTFHRDINNNHDIDSDMQIHWLEGKMFYGASSIPADNYSAVGKLLTTADKYVKQYGPGMMVFAYGCGHELAMQLKAKGVLVVDASPCDLTQVENQQKTWCADANGRILF